MVDYVAFLGQTADLAWEELRIVCARGQYPSPVRLTPNLAQFTAPDQDMSEFQLILGGTVKCARILHTGPHLNVNQVHNLVRDTLQDLNVKRFVVAEHGRDHLPPLEANNLKHDLVSLGHKVNYQEASRHGANAAQLKHHHLTELHVIQLTHELVLAQTVSWQDVDTWSQRDVEKPQRDRRRGMLPPKIARMMVNLALGTNDPRTQTVLDPFCGMGTILLEAIDLDVPHVWGNDIDPRAIASTNANLNWWRDISGEEFTANLTVRPAEKLLKSDDSHPVTTIVTEPFLGKLTPTPEQIPGVLRGLSKMYRGAYKNWRQLLEPGARLAVVVPALPTGRGPEMSEPPRIHQDWAELGYHELLGPLRAGRPEAHTQRHIYVLEYDPYGTR